jgi:hypothetical protein
MEAILSGSFFRVVTEYVMGRPDGSSSSCANNGFEIIRQTNTQSPYLDQVAIITFLIPMPKLRNY